MSKTIFGMQTVPRASVAAVIILITNILQLSCTHTPQDRTVTMFNEVLVLIGTAPQKLDLIVWNSPRSYVQSLTPNESQVRLDLVNPHNAVSDWSDIFERKRADELPMAHVFLPQNLSETLDLLSQAHGFYEKNPDQVAFVYFFVMWPEGALEGELNLEWHLMSAAPFLALNSHLYFIVAQNRSRSWELWEFYSIQTTKIYQQIDTRDTSEFQRRVIRRGDFKGSVLKGIVVRESMLQIATVFETANGSFVTSGETGLALESFRILESSLNFRTEYAAGTHWTGQDEYGNLTGTGSQLLNKEGDILLSFSTEILSYRVEKLGCSHPVVSHRIQAYYKKPDPSLFRDVLVKSFSLSLWAAVAASALMSYVCLRFFEFVERKYYHDGSVFTSTPLMWTIAAFCQQGWQYASTSFSTQIVAMVTLAGSLLCYTAYAASIVSLLSVDYNPIHDINDLLSYGYTLYGNRFSVTGLQHAMNLAEEGLPRESRYWTDDEPVIETLNNSKSAMLSIRSGFFSIGMRQNYTMGQLCAWMTGTMLPRDEYYQKGAIFFRKFSPLKKFIDYQFNRWRDTGLIRRFSGMFDQTPMYQCDPPREEPRELSLADLRGAFNLLVVGFISSSLILALELLVVSIERRGERLADHGGDNDVVPGVQEQHRVQPKLKTLRIRKLIRHRIRVDAVKTLARTLRRKIRRTRCA